MQEKKETKTLLLVRHAKSSWDLATLSDFERPLNDRGKKDAPMMAQRLLKRKVVIDAFVSSPAKRAKKTAELFCSEYDRKESEIIFISKLYHASPDTFFETIAELNDDFKTVALFSHNNGITEFANSLVEDVSVDNMPTCSIFCVSIETDSWKGFKDSKKSLLFFDYPKKI